MLKVEKKDGLWRARIVGRPSTDLRTALLTLMEAANDASGRLDEILGDDPCGCRDCGECDIAGCDPEEAAQEFAADAEIAFAASGGLGPEDVEKFDEPVDPRGPDPDFEPDVDEAQEWHDFDPDC